jgi:hypothetical protein
MSSCPVSGIHGLRAPRCNDLSRAIEALDRHHSDQANGSSQTSPPHRDPRRPVRLGRLQVLIRLAGTVCIEPSDERFSGAPR